MLISGNAAYCNLLLLLLRPGATAAARCSRQPSAATAALRCEPRSRHQLEYDRTLPPGDYQWFMPDRKDASVWMQGKRQYFVFFEMVPPPVQISPGARMDILRVSIIRGDIYPKNSNKFVPRAKQPLLAGYHGYQPSQWGFTIDGCVFKEGIFVNIGGLRYPVLIGLSPSEFRR